MSDSSSQSPPEGAAAQPAGQPGRAKFLTGSIPRHVLVMTSTGAIGLVSIFLAELIDVLFLSMLGDVEVLAAIGYSGPLVFLTVAFSIGLSIATVSLVAPALGAGERDRARRISGSVHVFTLIASAVLSLALVPFLPWLLGLIGAKSRTADHAFDYLAIVVPSLPPLALAMTSSAVLRSLGDARRAMHVTLGAAVVVVVLDPILIFWMGLGLQGAAIATVLSRIAIMGIGLHAVWRVHGMIERPTLENLRIDAGPVLTIALPAMATNAATPIANAIVTAAFAPYGDSAVAGWAVIGRIQPVAFGFVFAMSGSVGPIIGQNLGAGLHGRMREAFAASLRIAAAYTVAAWAMLALAAPLVISVFKASGEGAALIQLYCLWLAPVFGFQSALFIANAVFNTLGRPRVATLVNWARAILGTLPFTAVGGVVAGAPGVLAGNLVGGALFAMFAVWLCWRLMEVVSGGTVGGRSVPAGEPVSFSPARRAGALVAVSISSIYQAAGTIVGRLARSAGRGDGASPEHGRSISSVLNRVRTSVLRGFAIILCSAKKLSRSFVGLPTKVCLGTGDSERRSKLGSKEAIAGEITRWRDWAIALPRPWKRLILAVSDFLILSFAVWLAISLRYNGLFVPPHGTGWLVMFAAPAIGVFTFAWFGLYRQVTRFITTRGSARLLQCIGVSVLFWALLAYMFGALWIPRSVILVLYPLLGGGLIFASRQIYAAALRSVGVPMVGPGKEPRPVVIYGAGRTGVQLLDALHHSGDARVVGFLDDTASLWGQYAGGVKIYRPDKLERLIERESVREIILALPESRRRERREVLKALQRFPVRVKTLPDMEDFATGRAAVSDLRPIDVDDLLGRDPVPADAGLLALGIRGKAVLVTGAGGSIGSELVRQVLRQHPLRIVLLDVSEVALYEIETEIADAIAALPDTEVKSELVGVLGSVLDADLVRRTIERYRIATVFHAAAYKHVPIVESNPVAGITNNTFGTRIMADAARALGVERFVLISTDKAVRPTNIMGASKRLAELVLQAHANDPGCGTVFTMVRFGNVLDSSGSVVRRFRKQIQDGGPVTVTHKDVVRYFMSIPEAATLVLQAGAMASGGEVFVLDMGEPVKIAELARSMVRLMGLDVRDEENPEGDIEIVYVGLRPGEKLYEELLIGENTTPTKHPLIRRSSEPHLPADSLARELTVLRAAMGVGRIAEIEAVLERTVEGYRAHVATETGTVLPLPIEPASRTLH